MSNNIMKNPPKYNVERPFSRFKEEVLAWAAITSVDKKIQGTLVTLNLPETGRFGDLKGKVIDSVKHGGDIDATGENQNNGLDLVLTFLEEHLGGDEVTNICEKIKTFMDLKRTAGQTVREYVSDFEHAYTVAQSKAKLRDLPGHYLMYTMVKNAGITEQDEKLILSGINLDNEATIYKETKLSLIKYCGDTKHLTGSSGAVNIAGDGVYWQGAGRGRGKFRPFPPRRPPPPVQKDFDPNKYHPKIQRDNMDLAGKKINPKKDGKVMTCDFCGSFLHLQASCWDKRNQRQAKTFAATDGQFDDDDEYGGGEVDDELGEELDEDDDEGVTDESEAFLAQHLGSLGLGGSRKIKKISTAHFMEDVTLITYDTNITYDVFHGADDDSKKKVLLDTGCVRTVCGQRWLAHVMADMDPRIKDRIKAEPSPHIFKFGGGEKLPSLGSIKIHPVLHQRKEHPDQDRGGRLRHSLSLEQEVHEGCPGQD